jgi:hypothetical protein
MPESFIEVENADLAYDRESGNAARAAAASPPS